MHNQQQKVVAVVGGAAIVVLIGLYYFYKQRKSIRSEDKSKDGSTAEFEKDGVASAFQNSVEIKVPKHVVGIIIGKNGTNIRKLKSEFGVRFDFESKELDEDGEKEHNEFRNLVIKGQRDKVHAATLKINSIIGEAPEYVKTAMYVPQEACGRIIGKGGQNIRDMCNSSGAKIEVDRDNSSGESNTRKVLISGNTVQVDYAKVLVQEKVEQDKYFRENNRKKRDDSTKDIPRVIPLPKDDDYFKVFVSAVESPNSLWIQLVREESTQLDLMNKQISDTYANLSPSDIEKHKLYEGRVGTLCIAPYEDDGEYYRAKITKINGSYRTADLLFVDFGDRETLPIDSLLKVKDEFLVLPLQAVQCSLSLLRKGTDQWSEEVVQHLESITHCAKWKYLLCKVIQASDNAPPIVQLLDPNHQNRDIASDLVSQGFALNMFEDSLTQIHDRAEIPTAKMKIPLESNEISSENREYSTENMGITTERNGKINNDVINKFPIDNKDSQQKHDPLKDSTQFGKDTNLPSTDIDVTAAAKDLDKEFVDKNVSLRDRQEIVDECIIADEEHDVETSNPIFGYEFAETAERNEHVIIRDQIAKGSVPNLYYETESSSINQQLEEDIVDEKNVNSCNSAGNGFFPENTEISSTDKAQTDSIELTKDSIREETLIEKPELNFEQQPISNDDIKYNADMSKAIVGNQLEVDNNISAAITESLMNKIDEPLSDNSIKVESISVNEENRGSSIVQSDITNSSSSVTQDKAIDDSSNMKKPDVSQHVSVANETIIPSVITESLNANIDSPIDTVASVSDDVQSDIINIEQHSDYMRENEDKHDTNDKINNESESRDNRNQLGDEAITSIEEEDVRVGQSSVINEIVSSTVLTESANAKVEIHSENDNNTSIDIEEAVNLNSESLEGFNTNSTKDRTYGVTLSDEYESRDAQRPLILDDELQYNDASEDTLAMLDDSNATIVDDEIDKSQPLSSPANNKNSIITESFHDKINNASSKVKVDILSVEERNLNILIAKNEKAFAQLSEEVTPTHFSKDLSSEIEEKVSSQETLSDGFSAPLVNSSQQGGHSRLLSFDDDFVDIDVSTVNGTLTAVVSEKMTSQNSDNTIITEEELQKSLDETSRKNVFASSMEMARENLISLSMDESTDTDSYTTARTTATITDTDDTLSFLSATEGRSTPTSSLNISVPDLSINNSMGSSLDVTPIGERGRSSSKFEIQFIDETTNSIVSRESLASSFEQSLRDNNPSATTEDSKSRKETTV